MTEKIDYTPSMQVDELIEMILDERMPRKPACQFNDGVRHGLNRALWHLVQLESKITDPDIIDELCGEMLTEAAINRE